MAQGRNAGRAASSGEYILNLDADLACTETVLEEAVTRFDWVVLDTPPVGLLPDANLLGAMVDAVVLVVRAGKTPHAAIQSSVQALGRDRIVGVVLNRAEAPADAGYELYAHRAPAVPAIRKALSWRRS